MRWCGYLAPTFIVFWCALYYIFIGLQDRNAAWFLEDMHSAPKVEIFLIHNTYIKGFQDNFFHGGEAKVLFPAQKLHFSGIFKVSSTHHELENWRRKMSKKLKMRFSSPLISNGRGLYTAFRTHDCQNQTSYDFFPEARSSMEWCHIGLKS